MQRGYVKLWRKSIENCWLREPTTWVFWCYCLLKASHKPIVTSMNGAIVHLEPGQFVFGREIASKETGISVQRIRTAIERLKSTSQITIKSTSKFSIVSVCNWELYQCEETKINQQNNQHVNQQLTSNQPATNQQLTTYKNNNTITQENNNTPLPPKGKSGKPISDQIEFPDGFDTPAVRSSVDEWQAYRKTIKKPATANSLTKRMKQLETPARFIAAVDYSIAQGWTGIYEEKTNGHPTGTSPSGQVGRPSGPVRNQSPARPRSRYGPGGCGSGYPKPNDSAIPAASDNRPE